MRAIVVKDKWLTSLDELVVSNDVPEPKLTKGTVLVKVVAVGVNFFDTLMVQGKYQVRPPFPFIPGTEFSGVVIDAHFSVGNEFRAGDRVFGSVIGCYAERLVVSTKNIIKVPEKLSFEEAAGLYITYPTSYAGLVDRAQLKRGEWCLVHAAAGGVGIAAVQIAKALGAKVIATAGSQEKRNIAKRFGADHVVDYGDASWPDKVRAITKGRGVDVVYDPVGLIDASMKCIAFSGRLVVVGFTGGDGKIEKIATNRVLLKNIAVTGVHWGAYVKLAPEKVPIVWNAIFELIAAGHLTPVIYEKVYRGLEKVPDALRDLGSRKTWGKVIVTPNGTSDSKL